MADVTKYDDVIDSRDVLARIKELEGYRDDLVEAREELIEALAAEDSDPASRTPLEEAVYRAEAKFGDEELAALQALASEADLSYAGCGETLIRNSYFRDYAMELAEDIGAIPSDVQWPCSCIDWDQAARDLQMDYSSVEFDGVTYWIRS